MSFTDGQQRVATEEDVKAHWGGAANGRRFRCYLCGHKFVVGDKWRFVYANGSSPAYGNFIVCSECDNGNVLEKWNKLNEELKKYWWLWDQDY
jgi:hypothetical protein